MRLRLPIVLITILIPLFLVNLAEGIRIKDIAEIVGVRQNRLIGYGLVIGLNGTGDKDKTEFTLQSMISMLERMGIKVDADDVKVKNVAAVIVTANLPPFARRGTKIDILVSSLGDAKSLQGGTLLLTTLKGGDGNIYAVAQGTVSTGGFAFGGSAGGGVQVNHPTVGKVIGGAQVEREIAWNFNEKKSFLLSIHNPDFATSCRLAGAINADFQQKIAGAVDSGTVKVEVPESYAGNVVELITRVERLKIIPDTVARVVLDERTGTIVIGENVRISTVAISHGNLSIVVKERKEVSQPFPFAPSPAGSGETNLDSEEGLTLAPGGQTVITPDSEVVAEEEKSKLILISSGTTINELVRALNAIGVSPRDLIAIFQSMKAAGVLQAELEII